MESPLEIPRVPMQITAGYLVASIQVDLTTALLRRFQQDLLERVKIAGVSAVIVDVSAVEIMDLEDFELLRRSMAMASIMGARPILVGLRPGTVASLVALDAQVDGIEAAADLDDALRLLQGIAREPAINAEAAVGDFDPKVRSTENGDARTEGSDRDRN